MGREAAKADSGFSLDEVLETKGISLDELNQVEEPAPQPELKTIEESAPSRGVSPEGDDRSFLRRTLDTTLDVAPGVVAPWSTVATSIRPEVAKSLSGRVVTGAQKSVAEGSFALSELSEDHFIKAIDELNKMRADPTYTPRAQDLNAGDPIVAHYVRKALHDSKQSDRETAIGASLEELQQLRDASNKEKQVAEGVASSYRQDLQDITPADANFVEQAAMTAAESFAPTAAAVAGSAIAGPEVGVALGAGLGGAAAGASSYMEATLKAKKMGIELTPEKKAQIALTDAFLETIGEGLSLRVALKTGVPLFDRWIRTMGAESSSEVVTQMMQDANEVLQYNPNMSLKDFLYDAALAGVAGAMGGTVVTGGVELVDKVGEKVQNARAAYALDELIRTNDPALLTPEEEARRLLDPNVSGKPLETPQEALQYSIRNKMYDRAAELADKINGIPDHEPAVLIAKRMLDAGEIDRDQMLQFRKAVIKRRAEAQDLHAGELTDLSQRLTKAETDLLAKGDEEYFPTEEEMSDLNFARQLNEELSTLQGSDIQLEHLLTKLDQQGTWLAKVYKEMAASAPSPLSRLLGALSSWNSYEIHDFRRSTRSESFSPSALAQYFGILAQRQAEGLYPFSAELTFPFKPLVEKQVPQWNNSKGEIVADTDKMPLGTSVTSMSDYMRGKRITSVVDSWLKKFAPTGKLFIIDATAAQQMGERIGPGNSGFTFSNGPKMGVLYVDSSMSDEEYFEVLAHEFGHYLGNVILESAPAGIKKAVMKAWSKDIRARLNMNWQDSVNAMRGVVGASRTMTFGVVPPGMAQTKTKDFLAASPFLRGYLYSFEEWKAHQMERMLTSNGEGLSDSVLKYFKDFRDKLKKFFAEFKNSFAANKTFEEFVRYGALREKAKFLQIQRMLATQQELGQFGIDELSDEETKDLRSFLEKSFAQLKAPAKLRDDLRNSPPEVQQRAATAIQRIGMLEASLFTPKVEDVMTAEQWTSNLEDAWLPGQEPGTALRIAAELPPEGFRIAANKGMPKAKSASRLSSFVKNALKYSRYFRGKYSPDNSGYEGHLDKYSWFMKWAYSLEQWAKVNPHIEQLQDYLSRVRDWARDRMAWISRADQRLRQWRSLTQEEQKVLGRFMLDQTQEGKFYNPSDPAVQMKYPLTPRALEMYSRIKSDFDDFITAIEGTLTASAAKRLSQNPFAAAAEMKRIKDRFAKLREKPYFPLSRFGDFLVIVRATKHIRIRGNLYNPGDVMHFEAFDTDFARKAELDRIRGAYPSGDIKLDMASEAVKSLMGMPQPIIEALKSDPNIALSPEQKKAIDEYLYKIAPGQSFVKHLIQRKGVEGYTEDVMRGYASYFFHGASHLARIKHSEALAETIKATDITADLVETDSSKRRLIANYMRRHFDFIMHPENDWAGVRAVIAVAYLAGILKTAWVNLTQVPLVTYPHLAAKFGDAKAIRQLQKAYGDALAMYHVTKALTKQEEEALSRWAQGAPLQPGDEGIVKQWSKLTADERRMLRQAQLEGWIDESQAMELAAMSEGSWLTRFKSTSKAGYYWRWFSQYSMIPFQAAEKLNRRVTAIAAFRLALQEGNSFDNAYAAAREAVSASQYEYAKWNRAELLRGKKGVMFMFMQYTLNTLFFATGGDKGWWRWWALMLLTAGWMGLPFAQNLTDLATWALTRWKGDRVNAQHELRKLAAELGEALNVEPDLLLHGISHYGFGLIPFADMSGSLSMGRILPGTDLLASSGGDWNATVARAAADVGGATSSLVMRMLQAASQDDADTLRRVERGMPVTLGQQVLTAMRWYTRGAAETAGGADLIKFDTNDPWQLAEIAGKGVFGLQPRRLTEAREESIIKQDFANYYRIRREILMRKLDHEMEHGDRDSIAEVRDAIKRFNESVPSKSLSITNQQIIRMRMEKEKSRFLLERGQAPQRMYRDLFKQVEEGKL